MGNLTDSLTIISAIFGLLSFLFTVITIIKTSVSQRKKLKELRKHEFEMVLESSDIVVVGNYLDHEIGQLSISDYSENNQLTKRVDTLLHKLTRFVGTEEDISEQEELEEEKSEIRKEHIKSFLLKGQLNAEFKYIFHELYKGEAWNALARLRRYIEILLKNLANKNNLQVEGVHSVTQLIEILKRKEIIDLEVARNLKYPIHISNRAIHGQKLKEGEAEEAIFQAAYTLNKIINDSPIKG